MKDKKKDGGEGGGGGRRGSRKNIVGSESQGLLQAAAGTGFIGFSAFEAGGSTASTGYDAKAAGRVPGSKMQDGSSKTQGVSSTKSAGREKNKAFKMAAGHAASRGSGQVLPPQYSGSDSYLAVVSKRLAKRDVTTKLKALAELRAMCRQVAGDTAVMPNQTGSSDGGDGSYDGMRPGEAGHTTSTGALGEMAPHWVFLYQRLTTEGDRRTREAANITLLCFMKATRRAFQPVMSSLMASWWCSQADTASEVSAAAKEAFVSVFPKAKRALVLGRCAGEVLRQIDSQLAQTPESLQEASGCSVEEAESRAERLAISAIDGLANLMETVGRETNERLCRAPQHEPTLPEEEQSVNGSNGDGDGDEQGDMTYWSVANDRLWERLVDPRPVVRRAAYGLVSACCRHAPALLLPRPLRDGSPSQPSTQNGGGIGCEAEGTETVQAEWDKGATGGLGKRKGKKRKASRVAAPSLLVQLLGEKEVANHRQAWEAVLLVMEMSKRSWTAEEGAEMVLPTVVKKLEKGAFIASAASSYPCLLPFVASLSMETLLLPSNGRIGSPGKMAREQDTMTETETRTEGETALSASGTSGASFCLDFLRAVWMPLEHPPSGLSAGHEGENGAWVAQIVSAHLECIAFLLLKLQPDPRSIATGSGSPGSESVALGQARAVRDVAREAAGILVVYARSILLTEVEEVEALHAKVGRKIRGSGAMRVVGKAFGRVMGQLHLGARRGAGMMGFPAWAEASLWGGLLETLIEALDRRSEGISAMADALVHALGYVKVGTAQGATAGSERGAVLRDGGDGLLGVCRAAFQHCASCIDGVALDGGGDGRNPWKATDVGDEKVEAVGQREVPLASLMASLSRALGLRNCLLPKSGASGTAGTASGDPAPSEDVHTDDVSRAFYRDFIVPRLTATAAAVKDGDNSARRNKGGKAESAPLDSLSDMVRVHFSESDSVGDDFSCLVLGALSQPGVERFETCSTVLRLAPEDFSGTVPCLEDALLQACGVATETGGGASPGEGSSRNGNSLPTFVKACLGTWGERRETQAFVASGVVREVIETSLEILRGGASPSSRSSSSGACGETHTIALLALDGLLGVLAADSSKSRVRRAPSSHEAIDVVKQVGVDLLLAAFREFGERGALGKLWQGNGVRALRRVMGRTGPRGESRVSDAHRDVWESFVEGAAEHTRRVMEGGEDDRDVDGDRRGDRGEHGDGDGRDVSVAGKVWRVDLVSPERASVLALELMKWEQELGFVDPIFPCAIPEKGFPYETADFVSRAAPSGDVRRETLRGHRSHASYLPALWRLGLTRAGVWQHRRREAFDGTEAKTAAELARSCLASRWARRWQCLSSICSRLQSARARLLFLMEVVSRGASAYPSEGTAGVVLHEAVAAGLFVHHAGSFLHTASVGASKDMEAVDLPPGLLIPSAMAMAVGSNKPCGDDRGRHGSTLGTGAVSRALEALGVGIACWRKAPPSQDTPTAQAADVIGAAVMDAASMHLTGIGHAKVPENSSGSNSSEMMPPGERVRDASRESWGRVEMGVKWDHVSAAAMVHPFSLLLPQDLWQASFERSSPRADEVRESVEDAPASRDTRCHEVLLAGLRSAVGAMALDAARSGDRQSEASAWWLSCAAEVTSGFMSALLGETFVLGLGLGTSASRVMASRCGAYKPATPTPADLAPGARTLYTREGQAVTVVAEHKDKGGGEPYYTVRPLDTVGHEKQTVLGRLFLSPPMESDAAQAGGDDSKSSCPWIVRYPVAVRLTEILVGTVLGVEERLWGTLRSRGVESRPDKFGLAVAAAVSLRSCASACVRSALLSASWSPSKVHGSGIAVARPTTDPTEEVVPAGGMDVWEEVGPRLIQVRDRWASVCVKSGLVLETGRVGESGEGSEADARVAVALSTSVLSAFFCGTPFLPSDEASMKFVPARLEKALTDGAEDDGSGLTTPGTPCEGVVPTAAWERARALASLVYFRDATDASCRVQLYPTPASVGGELCDDVQARMEGALLALVSMARCTGWGGGELDLALARAASGLLGVEAARVGAGRGASLALDTKAAIVSWALSKFLLSGSRIAGYGADGSGGGGAGFAGSDRAVCLEVSRLLTAVAWDGRKGWGGDGSSASRARYLVAGPEEAAEVWAEARSPTVWKGLHAALVGAVRHPTIQVCAFEVLEAAAGGWDCGGEGSVSAEAKEDDSGSEKGPGDPEEIEREEDAQEAEGARGWTGGSSIVSRLATALGGWGLGSVARSEREVGDAQGEAGSEEGGGADDEGDGGMPSEQVREETAKEQQDDLELIARCFPEDLLLAVESLSGTIYALNDEGDSPHAQGRRRSHLSVSNAGEYSDDDVDDRDVDVSDDKLELEELEESVPQEAVEKDVGEGGILDDDVLPEDKALDESDEGEADLDVQEEDKGGDRGAQAGYGMHQPSGRSRRRRLRRRRQADYSRGSDNSVPSNSRSSKGERSFAEGPSLTGPLLTWLLWLEHCQRASECEGQARTAARAFITRAGVLGPVMEACLRVLKAPKVSGNRGIVATARLGPARQIRVSRLDTHNKPLDLARLALAVYFRTVHVFPALTRAWWADDCPRSLRVWAAEFTKMHVSPALIQIEAEIIADATTRGIWEEGGEMAVRASATSRQVVASYVKEECTLEACIQLPPEYPLRSVEVTCSRRMGVAESRWRTWVLQIVTLLSLQDGSVLDAVMLWKKNVDKEFEGVEPCVICYVILHPRDMALPRLSCKTCKNRFHSSCLYRWFHTSHKSKCPICQQQWV